jgi:hypothetical protein
VDGFVKKFHAMVEKGNLSRSARLIGLLGAIKGAADLWLQQQKELEGWSYEEILDALKKQFGQI